MKFIKQTFEGLWWDIKDFFFDWWWFIAIIIVIVCIYIWVGQTPEVQTWMHKPVQEMTVGDIVLIIAICSALFRQTIKIKRG